MEGPSPRIVKETKTIQTDPVKGITFKPDPNNYKHFFITLEGIHHLTQVPPTRAIKEAPSTQSFCCLTITPCHHPKLSLTQRFTIPTSVLLM